MASFVVGSNTYLGSKILSSKEKSDLTKSYLDFEIYDYDAKPKSNQDAVLYLQHPSRKIYENNICEYFEQSIMQLIDCIKELKAKNFKHFIYSGSYYQNPRGSGYIKSTPYVASKEVISIILETLADKDFKISWLELFDIYGDCDERTKLLTSIVNSNLELESMKITHPQNYIRPIHYSDVIKGIKSIIELRNLDSNFFCRYSLPGPESFQIFELVKAYERRSFSEIKSKDETKLIDRDIKIFAEVNYQLPLNWECDVKFSEFMTDIWRNEG